MKKFSKFIAAVMALTMTLTPTLTANAYWYEDEMGVSRWEQLFPIVYRTPTAEELFPYASHEVEPEEISWPLYIGDIKGYKEFLEYRYSEYNFSEEEVQILFEDYRERWIEWCKNVRFNEASSFSSELIIYTDSEIELTSDDFDCIIDICSSKFIDADTRYYFIQFLSFDDLETAQEMLLQKTGVRSAKLNFHNLSYSTPNILDILKENVRIYDSTVIDSNGDGAVNTNLDVFKNHLENNVMVTPENNISDYKYTIKDLVTLAKRISGKLTASAIADNAELNAVNFVLIKTEKSTAKTCFI